jgi:hypothetical protein
MVDWSHNIMILGHVMLQHTIPCSGTTQMHNWHNMSQKLSPKNSSATSDICVGSDGNCFTPGFPVNCPKVGVLSTFPHVAVTFTVCGNNSSLFPVTATVWVTITTRLTWHVRQLIGEQVRYFLFSKRSLGLSQYSYISIYKYHFYTNAGSISYHCNIQCTILASNVTYFLTVKIKLFLGSKF